MSFPIIKNQIKNSKPDLWELVSAIAEHRAPRLHRDQVERFLLDLTDLAMLERTVCLLGCDEDTRVASEKMIKTMEEDLAFVKKKEERDKIRQQIEKEKRAYFIQLFAVLNDDDEIPPLVKKLWKDIKKGQTKIQKSEKEIEATRLLLDEWKLNIELFKNKLQSLLDKFYIDDILKPEDFDQDVDVEWDNKVISLSVIPSKGIFFVNKERKTIYAYQFDINGTIITINSDTIYHIINNKNCVNSVELTKLYRLLFGKVKEDD